MCVCGCNRALYSVSPTDDSRLPALAPADVPIKPSRSKDEKQLQQPQPPRVAQRRSEPRTSPAPPRPSAQLTEAKLKADVFTDAPEKRDELGSFDQVDGPDRVQLRASNATVGRSSDRSSDKSVVSLVEELVRSR